MRTRLLLLTLLFTALATTLIRAQSVEVSRANRTIAITAEEDVSADAEVAILKLGYENYGPTKDSTFQENARVGAAIVRAVLDAGVPKGNVETESVQLKRVEYDEEKPLTAGQKAHQFEASQSWRVRVPAAQAEAIVDVAVRAGANKVDDVEWTVEDPVLLQARADGAALKKARTTAEHMAEGLGAKLGDLVYASNQAQSQSFDTLGFYQSRIINLVTKAGTVPPPNLKIFPQKVKRHGKVYAVFAIP